MDWYAYFMFLKRLGGEDFKADEEVELYTVVQNDRPRRPITRLIAKLNFYAVRLTLFINLTSNLDAGWKFCQGSPE